MSTITELQQALRGLSAAELESIADWLEGEVENSRYRTFHVGEAQPEYLSEEEPLFMTWDEYLAFEEQSLYRHEYVNGTVHAMSGGGLAHNRQRVEAIEEYVLIAQNQPRLIAHRRAEDWRPMVYSAKDARVEFRSIGLHMPLAQIYEGTLDAKTLSYREDESGGRAHLHPEGLATRRRNAPR